MLQGMAKSNLDFSLSPAAARSRIDPNGAVDHGHAAENPHPMNSATHPRRKGRSLWNYY
ncbi:MAG: hypothetical protein GY850_15145 [bacterium]|nr:hypothetical protein [bacterium]